MKAWSLFYPDVLPELPGAPVAMIDHWLRNAAIEFCERSKAHVTDLAPVSAVADQMSYAIPLVTGTELVEINELWFSGERLTPKSPGFLSDQYADWTIEIGAPDYYTQQDAVNVLLVPAPDTAETDAIKIKASIKPGTAATGIDDMLFSKWRIPIGAGCKAKMMAMAGKPWSNPDNVILYLSQFEAAIAEATPDANAGFVRARPRFSGKFC